MTSVSRFYLRTFIFCWLGLAWSLIGLLPSPSHSGPFSLQERQYGPTSPGGYAIRVSPHATSMAHSQRRAIEVYVETPEGQPADGVAGSVPAL